MSNPETQLRKHELLNELMTAVARSDCADKEKEEVVSAVLAAVKGDFGPQMELVQEGLRSLLPISGR